MQYITFYFFCTSTDTSTVFTMLECGLEELAEATGQVQELLVGMQKHSEVQSIVELPHIQSISGCISFSELDTHVGGQSR